MAELLQYKCPNCGGQLEFNSTVQKMKCPYCETVFPVETLSEYDDELKKDEDDHMHWDTSFNKKWEEGETQGMRVYHCDSCGGEIIADESTGASKCPYCDNPVVMVGTFKGDLKPDCIIPFKYDKNVAKERYLMHLEGKKLLPKVFKDENHIDEIKGIYVPFWLFDCDVDARIRYRGYISSCWSDSEYDYIKQDYYSIIRGGSIGFDKVPHDGSLVMPDDLMQSIEPFDFSDAVDFLTAYLSGYLADKYTVTIEDCIDIANERIKKTTEQAFKNQASEYEGLTTENSNIHIENSQVRYVLYPVWILNTTWQGKKYIFAMNGQTGKMVGDLPMDKRLYWMNFIKIGGIGAAVGAAISYLVWFFS